MTTHALAFVVLGCCLVGEGYSLAKPRDIELSRAVLSLVTAVFLYWLLYRVLT